MSDTDNTKHNGCNCVRDQTQEELTDEFEKWTNAVLKGLGLNPAIEFGIVQDVLTYIRKLQEENEELRQQLTLERIRKENLMKRLARLEPGISRE